MLEEIKHIKISKKVSSDDDLDFAFLKSKGIEYIESMGGNLWSDMNVHDPGVTILETLSYAITDLGNRINLPIESLIASEDDLELTNQFYRADKILPTSPTTALDYRMKFSDIPGVRNSWIIPFERPLYADSKNSKIAFSLDELGNPTAANQQSLKIKGLNTVIVDYDLDVKYENGDSVTIESINEQIKQVYHKHRNLCEDLVNILEVEEHPIGVCTNIQLENNVDEDLVHAKILNAIEEYFAPQIQHHSLKEMLDRGYRTDQIFEGPFLDKGFIDPKELADADLRSEVRLSDLVKIIMAIEGVKLITDISINDCQDNKEGTDWLIQVKPYTKPKLCSSKKGEDGCCTVSSFSYAKDILPVTINEKRVAKYKKQLLKEKFDKDLVAIEDRKIKVKRGQFMNSGDTTTIQNEFPETYGISQYGLSPNSSEARRSQAFQLKGYLSFFDQILASYFSHLSKVKDLLSISTGVVPTYFTQALSDIKDFDKLVDDYPMNDDALLADKLFQDLDDNVERRNAILDHLLARFAENFSEYTFLMNELYGIKASNEMVLYSKEQFLKEYVVFGAKRGDGYDIYGKIWDTDNVAGAQKRISRLTGIRNYFRRNLSRSLAQIYIPDDSTTGKVMWRIINNDGERLLYSALSFKSTDTAMSDQYKVIGKLAKMDIDEINEAFENGLSHGDRIDDVVIYQRPNGQYKFNVIDPTRLNPADEPEIIGIFSEWDVTLDDLQQHLIEIIRFLRQEFNEDGMYIIEHVFLLPDVTKDDAELKEFLPVCIEDRDDCCAMDPYSFKVSVILPGYTQRFADPDFRNYMELLIQAELPAHIVPRICWIGQRETYELAEGEINQLMTLEKAYRKYLTELKGLKTSETAIEYQTWLDFKNILFDLFTLHPTGRLHDCDSDDDLEGKIILGRTNLGSL